MKTAAKILLLSIVFFVTNSCTEEQIDSITNCWGQSSKVEIQYFSDPLNAKKITYSVKYEGSGSLSYIIWTFGDGKKDGENLKVAHTYQAAGTYEVQADVTIIKDGENCTVTEKETVKIN
jgi:PKD repeat protein